VEKWTSEWDITPQQKSDFLKTLVDAFAKAEQPWVQSPETHPIIQNGHPRITSYYYSLAYLRSLPSTSTEAQSTAVEVISAALRQPTTFDFDSLFKIDAIVQLGGHELFSLLRVFLSGGLDEFKQWESTHAGAIEKYSQHSVTLHCLWYWDPRS
jgi:translation initiation factor 3 subunit M